MMVAASFKGVVSIFSLKENKRLFKDKKFFLNHNIKEIKFFDPKDKKVFLI
jgi:hypothetical protein